MLGVTFSPSSLLSASDMDTHKKAHTNNHKETSRLILSKIHSHLVSLVKYTTCIIVNV